MDDDEDGSAERRGTAANEASARLGTSRGRSYDDDVPPAALVVSDASHRAPLSAHSVYAPPGSLSGGCTPSFPAQVPRNHRSAAPRITVRPMIGVQEGGMKFAQ